MTDDTKPAAPEPSLYIAFGERGDSIRFWTANKQHAALWTLDTGKPTHPYYSAAPAAAAVPAEPVGWLYEGIAHHTKGKWQFRKQRCANLETRWWAEVGPVCLAAPQPVPAPAVHWPLSMPLVGGGEVQAATYYRAEDMHAYALAEVRRAVAAERKPANVIRMALIHAAFDVPSGLTVGELRTAAVSLFGADAVDAALRSLRA